MCLRNHGVSIRDNCSREIGRISQEATTSQRFWTCPISSRQVCPEFIFTFLTFYVVLLFRSSTSRNFDDGDKHKEEFLEAVHVQNEAIKNIADDDNIEYDHELVHELVHQHKAPAIQEYNIRDNNVPVYFPNSDMNQRLNQDYIPFNQKKQTPYIPEHRLVHFDLKGAPPSIDYMKKVVTLSKKLGATGVLIEYEDMFPWTGR